MQRRIEELSEGEFDVLVVGGGIQGIAILHALTQQGFKVALVEQDDFASGTSANSLKVIHGGLRYLQTGDFGRMRRSIAARRQFMQLAPDLVRPQGFVIPTSKDGLRHPVFMRVALWLNDLISLDRNCGVASSNRLPPGQILRNCDFTRLLTGGVDTFSQTGALWFDALIHNAGRFTIELIKSAKQQGAVVCNYVRAEKYLQHQGKIFGIQAIDRESGESLTITAKVVVEVAGAGREQLQHATSGTSGGYSCSWLKATNLVFSRALCPDYAVGLPGLQDRFPGDSSSAQESRYFFFIPYSDSTLFGTFYSSFKESPNELTVTKDEVNLMLAHAQHLCPEANLTLTDVSMSHVGVVPASSGPGGKLSAIEKQSSVQIASQRDGSDGLISVQGVKYTESFQVADEVSKAVGTRFGRRYRLIRPQRLVDLDTDATTPISELARRAVRDEMAIHLTDFVLRRTTLGEVGYPGDRIVQDCAQAMAAEAGWLPVRVQSELAALHKHYEAIGARVI